MDTLTLLNDGILFILGLLIGSFLNVCILRIPNGDSIVRESSHCFSCGARLRWFELIPLFSFLFRGGRCAHCKAKISIQYPLVELGNALLWILVYHHFGFTIMTPLACLLTSALLVLSLIDSRTFEIPPGTTIFILVLGGFRLLSDFSHWHRYLIGFFAVSVPLLLIYLLSKGRGIGGGDVKLMAACGLFLGWQESLLALFLACFFGSLFHIIRMKFFHADRVLAMGPYLALGVFLSLLYGNQLLSWYFLQLTTIPLLSALIA